ncbi:hypothetical protein [Xylella fastidiosa]|uniref:Uncharacterized protein n=1 Tax=Xylella fastidiosa TaxID=2371 RepID=A0ABD7BXK8_XYLFS|nr:hypothetical protein [Xylella fastidiosa]ETE29836.1 hypothetical protein B398_10725 [Xylella fastidiosa 32]MDG5822639.1 hypothetical protein [Xylella fastidiosa subsp. pauca]MDG5826140.1 hypothetical protein [Xylella fastidiosa subsp. pauca]QPB72611.1 hypothetical protein XFHB_13955 [Xylella fastidiosa]QPB73258.1 hypothetical protein XFC3_13255 [Xylella fastidiosa]
MQTDDAGLDRNTNFLVLKSPKGIAMRIRPHHGDVDTAGNHCMGTRLCSGFS